MLQIHPAHAQPDGKTLDPHSLHTACPVIKGIKYVGKESYQ